MNFKVAEVMVFTTCNYSCAYCGFATSGAVRDTDDMAPFKDRVYIDRVFEFFEKHSTPEQKWILHMSGGEPMMMPNLDYFASKFIGAGHKLAYNTNLSLPIESNGWMEAHPSEGIAAIIASLHPASLERIDIIRERVRILHEAGYPIAVRMVAHPKVIRDFPRLDELFRAIDVSFAVNAFYSPNYPQAYTDEERRQIVQYMRTNYQVIQLYGGLDMQGRRCRAGTDIICVALGLSGGGDIFPCVSTSKPRFKIGNIFDGDIKFYNRDVGCLRTDKLCSCAIHFTHGVVPFADDTESQQRMLAGYVSTIDETWSHWFDERGIKTKYHKNAPQGTAEGEAALLLDHRDSEKEINDRIRTEGDDHPLPIFTEWENLGCDSFQMEDTGAARFAGKPSRYGYLLVSPPVKLKMGIYQLRAKVNLEAGGITLGVLEGDGSAWVAQANKRVSGIVRLSFGVNRSRKVRFVIAACNHSGDAVSVGLFEKPKMLAVHDAGELIRQRVGQWRNWWQERWRMQAKPALNLAKLRCSVLSGCCAAKVAGVIGRGGYRVVDALPAGYAVRSIIRVVNGDEQRLITADIGHDTISILPLKAGKVGHRKVIQFPARSTPMFLSTVKGADGTQGILISFFNFDEMGEYQRDSLIVYVADVTAIEGMKAVACPSDIGEVLLQRDGYWGFRGTTVIETRNDVQYIGAVDREQSRFHLLTGAFTTAKGNFERREVDLGAGTEPIGVTASLLSDGIPVFYVTARNQEDLLVVGQCANDQWRVKQRMAIGGLSRSSVAIGRLKPGRERQVVAVTWGGDPKDINTPHQGKVIVGTLAADGMISALDSFPAGIHPTDVAVGDLDGDGIDEFAVLNYGTGLGPLDRKEPGSIQIYKFRDDGFQLQAEFVLANPRIAFIDDIDGDGVPELVVSLFFEQRLVVIKYC